MEPGLIWDRPPAQTDDLRSLLNRATQRLHGRCFVIIDQFEEFLILPNPERRNTLQQFLASEPIDGFTFLLVYRPEYEGLIHDQPWPRQLIDTNRKVVSSFSEKAAQEFIRKSGLTVDPDLMRAVLRQAAEIEQTTGLIRPVSMNMCGLVLGRFAAGLPRRFRGGLIRGFLQESLSPPEVRDVAGKLFPQLISDNLTKRPRAVSDLALSTAIAPSDVRACLRRLGEADRAVVRPIDKHQETWEISHDFLVPLLDSIVARRTVSLWRTLRPWLPWTATAVMGIAALAIPLIATRDPEAPLSKQGWTVERRLGVLRLSRKDPIPFDSISILRNLPPRFELFVEGRQVTDISAISQLKNLTQLGLRGIAVVDLSPLRDLTNLTALDISETRVADLSALRELRNLTKLSLDNTSVEDLAVLRGLKQLSVVDLSASEVTDISALGELGGLTGLYLSSTNVINLRPLSNLKHLQRLDLSGTQVSDFTSVRLEVEQNQLVACIE